MSINIGSEFAELDVRPDGALYVSRYANTNVPDCPTDCPYEMSKLVAIFEMMIV